MGKDQARVSQHNHLLLLIEFHVYGLFLLVLWWFFILGYAIVFLFDLLLSYTTQCILRFYGWMMIELVIKFQVYMVFFSYCCDGFLILVVWLASYWSFASLYMMFTVIASLSVVVFMNGWMVMLRVLQFIIFFSCNTQLNFFLFCLRSLFFRPM